MAFSFLIGGRVVTPVTSLAKTITLRIIENCRQIGPRPSGQLEQQQGCSPDGTSTSMFKVLLKDFSILSPISFCLSFFYIDILTLKNVKAIQYL